MQRRAWLQASAAAAASGLLPWLAHAHAAPRKHALLVGVGQLAQQPSHLWLQGPVHDVQHVQVALQAQGFAAQDMRVLSDAAQHTVPTRANILAQLQAMSVGRGDAVVLYWSGHGVRAAGTHKPYREADGYSTWLLARDAARSAPGSAWPLQGAVADAEVGAQVDRWLAAGAHVLVVMDTCHAASATRQGDTAEGLRWRGVRVVDLHAAQLPTSDIAPALQRLPAPQPRPRGFVGLYACESQQRTPEWRWQGVAQGLFTKALVQTLHSGQAQHYAQWARMALDAHAQLLHSGGIAASQAPSPVFEGSLQAPLWQAQALPQWVASTWPAHSARDLPRSVQVQVQVHAPGQDVRVLHAQDLGRSLQLGQLPVGTRLALQVRNAGEAALYLRVFHVAPAGRWQALFPEWQGDAALLPGARAQQPAVWQQVLEIHAAEAQPEALHWYVAPAQPHHWLEGLAPQAPLPAMWLGALQWQSVPSAPASPQQAGGT